MKVVIVGGVAGGATAAARIRRLDEQAEIVVFERSGYVSYANCGLPYYVGGTIADAADLTLQTPESFRRRFRIRMEVNHEVVAVDTESKTVTGEKPAHGRGVPGGLRQAVAVPRGAARAASPCPAPTRRGCSTCAPWRTRFAIREFVDEQRPRTAVVVGGGFIGLELAENLREAGLEVTIVQRPAHLMNPFDADMASFIHCRDAPPRREPGAGQARSRASRSTRTAAWTCSSTGEASACRRPGGRWPSAWRPTPSLATPGGACDRASRAASW